MTVEVLAAVYLPGPRALMLECADLRCVLTGGVSLSPPGLCGWWGLGVWFWRTALIVGGGDGLGKLHDIATNVRGLGKHYRGDGLRESRTSFDLRGRVEGGIKLFVMDTCGCR